MNFHSIFRLFPSNLSYFSWVNLVKTAIEIISSSRQQCSKSCLCLAKLTSNCVLSRELCVGFYCVLDLRGKVLIAERLQE